jgi:hypothetical protein
LLLAGSDSVAFSCSKASSLGSRSSIIAICTNSDGLHRIIYADWLKKSRHIFIRHIASAILSGTSFARLRVICLTPLLSDFSQVSKRIRRNNSVKYCVMPVAHHLTRQKLSHGPGSAMS